MSNETNGSESQGARRPWMVLHRPNSRPRSAARVFHCEARDRKDAETQCRDAWFHGREIVFACEGSNPDKAFAAWRKTWNPEAHEDSVKPLEKLILVYLDDAGEEHHQPACDLPECGTLIDSESGEDMEMVGWLEDSDSRDPRGGVHNVDADGLPRGESDSHSDQATEKQRWYVVIGRKRGDNEASSFTYAADDKVDALLQFAGDMLGDADPEQRAFNEAWARGENRTDEVLYLDAVFSSEAEIQEEP